MLDVQLQLFVGDHRVAHDLLSILRRRTFANGLLEVDQVDALEVHHVVDPVDAYDRIDRATEVAIFCEDTNLTADQFEQTRSVCFVQSELPLEMGKISGKEISIRSRVGNLMFFDSSLCEVRLSSAAAKHRGREHSLAPWRSSLAHEGIHELEVFLILWDALAFEQRLKDRDEDVTR